MMEDALVASQVIIEISRLRDIYWDYHWEQKLDLHWEAHLMEFQARTRF